MTSFFQRFWLLTFALAAFLLALFYFFIALYNADSIRYTGIGNGTILGLRFFFQTFDYVLGACLFCGFSSLIVWVIHPPHRYVRHRPHLQLGLATIILCFGSVLACATFAVRGLAHVEVLDAVSLPDARYLLGFKSNQEYGEAYYLFACDEFEWQCLKVAQVGKPFEYRDPSRLIVDTERGVILLTQPNRVLLTYAVPQ